jgi:hypothetical protein
MTPKKPEWFELTENGDPYAGIKKVNKKLPIATLVVAGAVILGGSVFATANNEPSAVAETPTASQSSAATQGSTSTSVASNSSANTPVVTAPSNATPSKISSGVSSLPVPKVTSIPNRGDDDHEGREGHERGEREHEERDHDDRDDD